MNENRGVRGFADSIGVGAGWVDTAVRALKILILSAIFVMICIRITQWKQSVPPCDVENWSPAPGECDKIDTNCDINVSSQMECLDDDVSCITSSINPECVPQNQCQIGVERVDGLCEVLDKKPGDSCAHACPLITGESCDGFGNCTGNCPDECRTAYDCLLHNVNVDWSFVEPMCIARRCVWQWPAYRTRQEIIDEYMRQRIVAAVEEAHFPPRLVGRGGCSCVGTGPVDPKTLCGGGLDFGDPGNFLEVEGPPYCPNGVQPEVCGDLLDNDCDGEIDEGCPCTPTNGGVEICDGIDNDCNGVIDDYPGWDQACVQSSFHIMLGEEQCFAKSTEPGYIRQCAAFAATDWPPDYRTGESIVYPGPSEGVRHWEIDIGHYKTECRDGTPYYEFTLIQNILTNVTCDSLPSPTVAGAVTSLQCRPGSNYVYNPNTIAALMDDPQFQVECLVCLGGFEWPDPRFRWDGLYLPEPPQPWRNRRLADEYVVFFQANGVCLPPTLINGDTTPSAFHCLGNGIWLTIPRIPLSLLQAYFPTDLPTLTQTTPEDVQEAQAMSRWLQRTELDPNDHNLCYEFIEEDKRDCVKAMLVEGMEHMSYDEDILGSTKRATRNNFAARCMYAMECTDWNQANISNTPLSGAVLGPFAFTVDSCAADGLECAAGLTCCDGTCVNLRNDESNCGRCGFPCPFNHICTSTGDEQWPYGPFDVCTG